METTYCFRCQTLKEIVTRYIEFYYRPLPEGNALVFQSRLSCGHVKIMVSRPTPEDLQRLAAHDKRNGDRERAPRGLQVLPGGS